MATKLTQTGEEVQEILNESAELPLKKGPAKSSLILNDTCVAAATNAVALGSGVKAEETNSFATGKNTTASGANAHAEGLGTTSSGSNAHAENRGTTASGVNSHAEGKNSTASGSESHAEGEGTTASGDKSHAEGSNTTAYERGSHAEGEGTIASRPRSHAEGALTTASGDSSHAEGYSTTAAGLGSHAEGYSTTASGDSSHAEGYQTKALNDEEHACGRFNKSTKSSNKSEATHFSIGIGTSDTDRKNAFEAKQNGDIYIIGIGGYDGANSDTAKDLITALDDLTQLDPEKYWTKDETEAAIKQQIDFVTGVDLSAYYSGRQVDEKLDDKQDKIEDLETIRANASAVTTKQDKIADLETIRANALKGATAAEGISEADLLNKYLNGQGRFPNDSQWVPIAGPPYDAKHEILGDVAYWPVSTSVTGDKGAFVKCLKYVGDNTYEYTYFYVDLSSDKIVHVRCADGLYYITVYNGQLVIYTQNSSAQISKAKFSVAPVYETESKGPAQMADVLIPTTIARHEDLFDLVEGLIGNIGPSRVIDPVVHVNTVLDITSDPDDSWEADINLTARQYLLLYRFGKALTDVDSLEFLRYFNFVGYSETDYVYNHTVYDYKIMQTQIGEYIQWKERFENAANEGSSFKFSLHRNDYEYAERGKFHIKITRA